MSSSPSKILEVFDNPNSERDFVIRIDSSEFTCLCPLTGQPDFADIHIEYIDDDWSFIFPCIGAASQNSVDGDQPDHKNGLRHMLGKLVWKESQWRSE